MSPFTLTLTIAMAASLAALFASADLAEARTPRKDGRALTVKKRPFTDTGKVAPVGSQNRYVMDTMQPRRIMPSYYGNRGLYGNETLPGPFGVYGN